MPLLIALVLMLTAADHWTTWLCLRAPVDGWEVSEANPLAAWLFGSAGLVPGIAIDSALTLVAIAFLVSTDLVPRHLKQAFFAVVVAWTGWAVANNLRALTDMGLSPFGGA